MQKILSSFKKLWSAWKNRTWFFKAMVIYSILLMGVVIGLCIWEWGVLEDYQNDYDRRYNEAYKKSKQGNIVCMEEYMATYTKEEHRKLVINEIKGENPYYSKEELADVKLSAIDFSNILYRKNEKNYSETKPVYDIYAGENVIATVTLTSDMIDEFGFNTWKVNGVSVDSNIEYVKDMTLIIENDMKVVINDKEPSDEALKESRPITQNIYDRIYELSGEEEKTVQYKISGLLNVDDIVVTDKQGNEVQYRLDGDVYVYENKVSEEEQKLAEESIDKVVTTYIHYTNRRATLEEMIAYTVDGSMAEKAMKNAAESVEYSWRASSITPISRTVDNVHIISDDLLYCDVAYEVELVIYSKKIIEKNDFTLIMRKVNGEWLLDTLAYNE